MIRVIVHRVLDLPGQQLFPLHLRLQLVGHGRNEELHDARDDKHNVLENDDKGEPGAEHVHVYRVDAVWIIRVIGILPVAAVATNVRVCLSPFAPFIAIIRGVEGGQRVLDVAHEVIMIGVHVLVDHPGNKVRGVCNHKGLEGGRIEFKFTSIHLAPI